MLLLLAAAAHASKSGSIPGDVYLAATGALAVHAYDQPETLLGQGSVGLELEADRPETDTLLVATGGGGLIGGIAAWYEGGQRSHPPVPLPDITTLNPKPNCSFQVPGSLMGAMQGASLSGLTSGAGGGAGMSLGWICSFSIPIITICAFFVLNIFLSLLNIVFFWLPFIKICIPFPMPSPATPDEGAP